MALDKTDLLVIGLIAGGLGATFVYESHVAQQRAAAPKPPATSGPGDGAGTAPVTTPAVGAGGAGAGPGAAQPGPEAPAPAGDPAHPRKDGLAFETPTSALALTTRGASVTDHRFKSILASRYRPVQAGDEDARARVDLHLLDDLSPAAPSFSLELLSKGAVDPATADWAHEALPGGAHRFALTLPQGVHLTKTYAPVERVDGQPDPYHFRLTVRAENRAGAPVQFGYRLAGPSGLLDPNVDDPTYGQHAVVGRRAGAKVEIESKDAASINEKGTFTVGAPEGGGITYWGLATKYFAAVVVPERGVPEREVPAPGAGAPEGAPAFPGRVAEARAVGLQAVDGRQPVPVREDAGEGKDPRWRGRQVVVHGLVPEAPLAPGAAVEDRYLVYVGPKQKVVFEAPQGPFAGLGLDKMIDFGWFEFMARILLGVLNVFHAVVGNWGVAIILLTFLVRGMLLPLSIWSQKNMLRMQKVGPELQKLKEQYSRKDGTMTPEQQRAFAAAQMELMRKAGVNPIGCLGPMFLQLPVFLGLWNALNYTFELRQQPFAGWITDLTNPDVLFRLPFTLPLLGTNAFSVLPLLMVATYWLQMQLQPPAADPKQAEQQRMMKFLMPVFGLFLYTFPSGLLLYFITSSLWGIAEQKWVKAHLERLDAAGGKAAVKAT